MERAACSSPKPRPALYEPRRARETPLYHLLEVYYEQVKAVWEERFERVYGFWRGFVDPVVFRYLDCGVLERGFARIRCLKCKEEYLLPFSCKCRGFCPSCGAKRAAAFSAFLQEELLEDVAHAQWVLTLPKMLRRYFLYNRELLGKLCRAAYDTVVEMMAAAVEDDGIRPAMVAVIQTFSDNLKWNPHVHCLATRGGWDAEGQWIPLPYVNAHQAELLFRHKVFKLLKNQGLLSHERLELLLSWKHTGFSIDNSVTVYPSDEVGLERLARYLMRSPVSLQRLHYLPETKKVLYQAKPGHDQEPSEILDPMELVARVLTHIPDPNRHTIHYFGRYSNRAKPKSNPDSISVEVSDRKEAPASKLRRRWADLIRRVYRTDPLVCPKCGSPMRILSFITQDRVIRKILEHLKSRAAKTRAPPTQKIQPVLGPVSP